MEIDGIGKLLAWAEFWILRYQDCQHEQWFPRTRWNYNRDQVEAEVRRYYATCAECSWPRAAAGR